MALSPNYVAYTLFVSNFIGVAFARTLHYQFYSWYFHAVPFLLWNSSKIPFMMKIILVGAVEYSYNIYPSTPLSSGLLQISHFATLVTIWRTDVPSIYHSCDSKDKIL
mmetsp:Transcript_8532/g.12159  ORF Transcript_8532/g.12159 Transcript_8532/m.12159 type:complete len:108 (-) Transcript_8532:295-618(-)